MGRIPCVCKCVCMFQFIKVDKGGYLGGVGWEAGGERQKKERKKQSISLKENRVHSYLHFI